MNNPIIDPVIKADKAIKLLGITGDEDEVYETLFRTAMHYKWPVFLADSEIYGVVKWYTESNENATFIPGEMPLSIEHQSESAPAHLFIGVTDEIELHVTSLDVNAENQLCAVFAGFYVNQDAYHYSDYAGFMSTTMVPVKYLSFYRANIESLFIQNTAPVKESNDTPTDAAQHVPKIQQRILAFKFWLVSTASERSPNTSVSVDTLQECYEIIGSPTRDEVWDKLNKIDKKLFRSGKDDFLKAAAKEIEFQTGRRPSN